MNKLRRVLMSLEVKGSTARQTHVERTQHVLRGDVSAVTVDAVTRLSPTVKGFTLRVENSKLSFKPGQWVDLHIPAVTTVGGYSITSAPHLLREEGVFTLAIQPSDHPPTLWMTTQCSKGDRLSVQVGGDFIYHPTETRLVELSRNTRRVKLLYSARNAAELLFKDTLNRLCSIHSSWLSVQYFVTQQQLTTPTQSSARSPDANSNIVERHMEKADISSSLNSLSLNSLACYVCGPPPMIDCATQWLTDSGVTDTHIHTEKWW